MQVRIRGEGKLETEKDEIKKHNNIVAGNCIFCL